MNNPIAEKFNKENPNYILKKDDYKWAPANSYLLCDKQGNFVKEFSEGSYGSNIPRIFPMIKDMFLECFGMAIAAEGFTQFGEEGFYIQWEHEGYVLDLRQEPEHPRTGGSHLRIYITEKV